MDTIKFDIYDRRKNVLVKKERVTILINGVNLVKMIRDIEFETAKGNKDLMADYGNIYIYELIEELDTYKNPTVLGCTCGVKDCSPLMVDVRETETTVLWENFKHSAKRRKPVDYSTLKFEFNKEQYYEEVNALKQVIR
ncbi:hypothetical protein M2480_003214 [Parabacteroides sp. PFB2-12]|uniref:hypothetical protein n=1 Tax=Parabacteroides sp. PFB2-12 TaxID=2940652 RepID=UPI002474C1E2|nr:hypothetical protein [Parabacteroides sp. PFB2-12]MDH6392205.1 hypothetical protein [Parabacteroides sp. PFB2-12]